MLTRSISCQHFHENLYFVHTIYMAYSYNIGFNMIDKKTKSRVRYKKTCEECDGIEVKQTLLRLRWSRRALLQKRTYSICKRGSERFGYAPKIRKNSICIIQSTAELTGSFRKITKALQERSENMTIFLLRECLSSSRTAACLIPITKFRELR